jgi:hypothetical protein
VWLPTLWGWLALLLGAAVCTLALLRGLYPFLAVTQPVGAAVLVVDGWLGDKELDGAIEVFRAGGYERIVTTGGPLHSWPESSPESTYAHRAADYLRRHGVGTAPITAAPSPITNQDRTYRSALMVRAWARRSGIELGKIDVVTRGPHARRSRLLYEEAFGRLVQVGVISIRPQDYDERQWWRSSTAAQDVAEQAVGLLWVELFFDPLRQDF